MLLYVQIDNIEELDKMKLTREQYERIKGCSQNNKCINKKCICHIRGCCFEQCIKDTLDELWNIIMECEQK